MGTKWHDRCFNDDVERIVEMFEKMDAADRRKFISFLEKEILRIQQLSVSHPAHAEQQNSDSQ